MTPEWQFGTCFQAPAAGIVIKNNKRTVTKLSIEGMDLVISTKAAGKGYQPLWVKVSIDPPYISKIKKASLGIETGNHNKGVVPAKGVWHRQNEFRDYCLETVCEKHKIRFRLGRSGFDGFITTKGICIETLVELSNKSSANNTIFYSADEPVLMAIYYSTR